MIRTVLTLHIDRGQDEALVETYRRLGILETSLDQEGCLSAEIAISTDHREAIVTAVWEDEAAYARWTSRADRADTTAELNPHLAVPMYAQTVGRVYRIAHRAGD